MPSHSARLYEQEHPFQMTTSIIDIIEQPVKVVIDGKPAQINAIGLILAETIFHPQGGGQPADQGAINGVPLLTVKEDKTEAREDLRFPIIHFLDAQQISANPFSVAQTVTINVDENFRKQCARAHSAGHLIADIVELDPLFSIYQAKPTHGHHFPGTEYVKLTIASMPENIEAFRQQVNDALKKAIQNDLPASMTLSDKNIRHIQIGNSLRMCGGTHVKSTKEIEACQILKIKEGKNKEGQLELTIFYQ